VFDDARHHHHASGTPGSFCVDCHMPATTYMVVDPRRDHSFRVPRPDLSARLDTPDACGSCHTRGPEWAEQAVERWFPRGRAGRDHYGQAIHAGRQWSIDRDRLLRELAADAEQPGIARATAVELLARQLDDAALDVIERLLNESEPLIQLAALGALDATPASERIKLAPRFLDHPLRALRIEAARVLVPAREGLGASRRAAFDAALTEYLEVQRLQADGAEGFYNSATVSAQLGRYAQAETELKSAIARDPWFSAAYVNLADLYRSSNRDADGESLLRSALSRLPNDASIAYALGLNLVRSGRREEASEMISRAAVLAPHEPLYSYAAALDSSSAGDEGAGRRALEAVNARFPAYRPALLALATLNRDEGRLDVARAYAEQLRELAPADATARALLEELTVLERQRRP
jgi:tetratricopeptide (TPR) repeat protein